MTDHTTHWQDMPEYSSEKVEPFATMTIRFETEQDLIDFANLIGQKLTPKTKSLWFPYKSHFKPEQKEWRNDP